MSKSEGKATGRSRRGEGKEREWRGIIEEQRRGGLSVRAYCRKLGVRETSFYRWRREIEMRDREVASMQKASPPVLAPVAFVDELHDGYGESRDASLSNALPSIEIMLDGGTTVRVPPHSTREQLAVVLSVLEQARC